MNPVDWDDGPTRSFPRNQNPDRQNVVEDAWSTDVGRTAFCDAAGRAVDAAQSGAGVEWKELGCPSGNLPMNDSGVEEPDGEPLEMDEEDPELARKRKELRAIEERILFKKAAIALKSVEPLMMKSCNNSTTSFALQNRVNLILQQKHPGRFLSTVSDLQYIVGSSCCRSVFYFEKHFSS